MIRLDLGERRGPKSQFDRDRFRSRRVVRLVQPIQQQHTGGHHDDIAGERCVQFRRGTFHVFHPGKHGQGARQVRRRRFTGR